MELAKMRSISEALSLIKAADPDSAVTYRFIKKLVAENKVRYFMSGKKIILDYDDLLNVINTK